jgi:hypothetical protein
MLQTTTLNGGHQLPHHQKNYHAIDHHITNHHAVDHHDIDTQLTQHLTQTLDWELFFFFLNIKRTKPKLTQLSLSQFTLKSDWDLP